MAKAKANPHHEYNSQLLTDTCLTSNAAPLTSNGGVSVNPWLMCMMLLLLLLLGKQQLALPAPQCCQLGGTQALIFFGVGCFCVKNATTKGSELIC